MSNAISSNERDFSLPYAEGDEFDSVGVSESFEVLRCGTTQNVNISFDRKRFSNSEYPSGSDCSSKSRNIGFMEMSPKSCSHESKTSGNLDVDDLIQSHIVTEDELNFYDQDSNSRNGYKKNNSIGEVKFSEIQSTSSASNSPSRSCDENVKDSRRLKTNSGSFNLGQILNKKKGSGAMRIDSSEDVHVDEFALNSRPFVFKKQNAASSDDNTQQTQMKTKLRTIWNNMKYGWRVKREVNLKLDSATWLLGKCYHNKMSDGSDVSKQLKLDLLSKIWLTYRINFPTIPGTDFMSDSGWGCMLRCGQMMMAQALVCHFLNRDWRVSSDQPSEKKHIYKMILRWFGDSLSDHSPLSLHHLVSLGENYGRKAGDWYGPTHAAQVLRDALIQAKRDHPELRSVCMYVALDGIVFKQDVMDLCLTPSAQIVPTTSDLSKKHQIPAYCNEDPHKPFTDGQKYSMQPESNSYYYSNVIYGLENANINDCSDGDISFSGPCPSYSEFGPPSFSTVEPKWTSLILFVSVRLGNDKINPFYIPCLKNLLTYEHCVGIIGGRPKHALYFIGWQDDKLIHMDPHSCQPAIDVEKDDFNEKSFHSSSVRTISFSEMDPSCAIGFYFKERKEFENFVEKFPEITAPMKKNLDYPVFALAEGKRIDVEQVDTPHGYARSSLSHTSSKTDEDDYILL